MSDYKTGAELLADFNCRTREQKLEHAVKAMLIELNMLHVEFHNQDLEDGLTDQSLFCSHADAYRMGTEALKP